MDRDTLVSFMTGKLKGDIRELIVPIIDERFGEASVPASCER